MGKYIADKKFYKSVLAIAVPIMVQNGITNFVSLLDNIMVGQVGTAQMSGVAIVNQILFVITLCLFGGCSGAGIFTAQYFGCKDYEGVRNTTRFKLAISGIVVALGVLLLVFKGEDIIGSFLHSGDGTYDIGLALSSAKSYMNIMLIGIIPLAFVQIYASTLRETGETVVPMKAGVVAIFINLALNWLLIFDHFGYKGLGVNGAAIATVISRFVEASIIVVWTHKNKDKNPFFKGLYKSLKIPTTLAIGIIKTGLPLMINEALWSLGTTVLVQCYSVRGLEVVAAVNITTTIFNLFSIVFIALGDSVAIIVGQLLGEGDMQCAKDTDTKLLFFSTVVCIGVGILLVISSPLFPMMYNTDETVRHLATKLIIITGVMMPAHAYLHAAYFTIRAGGKTYITFLFDCVYTWAVNVSLAFFLTKFTSLNIVYIFLACQLADLGKAILGFILIKKEVWLNNIVDNI